MPKVSHHNAIARQWEILKRLPARDPGISTSNLTQALSTDGFEVSKRTVERDLVELSRLFPIVCADENMPFRWYWAQEAELNIPGMTLVDAMSLHIVEDLLRPLLPTAILSALEGRFQQSRTHLEALSSGNKLVRWADKVRSVAPALAMIPPDIELDVLETIQQALLEETQLEVTYLKLLGEEPKFLQLHPLGMVQRGPSTYLVATAFEYEDVRLYAVHRITSAVLRAESVEYPIDFSLDDYIAEGSMQFGSGKEIRLKATVSDDLAGILSETPLSQDQKLICKGGGHQIQATVIDSWQLYWWIMSQGSGIEVLKPVHVRRGIEQSLQEALAVYQCTG